MTWKWIVVLALGGLSLALHVLTISGRLADPPVIRLSPGIWALVSNASFALAVLVATGLAVLVWRENVCRRRLGQAETQAATVTTQAIAQATAQVENRASLDRLRLLDRLSHELKNPLTAIRASLVNLAEAPSEQVRSEVLARMEAQVQHLSHLSIDLRKLHELETQPLDYGPVDVAGLLQEVLDMTQERPEAIDRHVKLTLPEVPWPVPAVAGDYDLLVVAIHNLLDNALKFTRAGDTVEVRAFDDGQSVIIEVADTGPGIPGKELDRVWEERYRGENARTVPGSGLGLELVRAVVARHNGQTTVRSRVGQGTIFTIRLPIADEFQPS